MKMSLSNNFLLYFLFALLSSFSSDSTVSLNKINCPPNEAMFLHHQCIKCLSFKSKYSLSVFNTSSSCSKEFSFAQEIYNIANQTLNRKTLKVVTAQGYPFSKLVEKPGGKKTPSGIIFEFLNAMEQKYNFTMNIFTSPDGNWGVKTKNGSWNGMIGLIAKGEADLGAASFSITFERTAVVSFTTAFFYETSGILIPAPIQGDKLTVLIRPLSPEVWMGIALNLAVFTPVYYVLYILSIRIHADKYSSESGMKGILPKILQFVIGSLVQISVKLPARNSTCLLVPIWWMTTLILAQSYVAFLISYLSVPKLYNAVNTLQELTETKKLKWTVLAGTSLFSLLKSDTSTGIFKAVGDGISDGDVVTSEDDGVDRVVTGKWAYIEEKSFLEVALDTDYEIHRKCRLTLANQEFFKVGLGIPVQKKCPYLPVLDREISITLATGLMKKWKRIHWPKLTFCAHATQFIIKKQNGARKLTLSDLQGAFFLLVSGLSIALSSFTLELTLHCARKIFMLLKRKLASSTIVVMLNLIKAVHAIIK